MNKQELIEKIKKAITDEFSSRHYYQQFDSYGYIEYEPYTKDDVQSVADDIILDLQEELKQLDEPQKPVVPECFDIDYKKYEYLKNNKSEILMTAIGGIHRVSFPGSFKDLPPFPWKTGIKWNKWTRETILWASRNYADFCQAVISGDYEVEKEPLYYVKLPVPNSNVVGLYLGFNREGEFDHSYGKPHATWGWKYTFTESEIKAMDERYWPFAVPAEEVAEG